MGKVKHFKNIKHRQSIRLNEYDYANPNWYYVTICTKDKKCVFGKVRNGKLVLNKFGMLAKDEWIRTVIDEVACRLVDHDYIPIVVQNDVISIRRIQLDKQNPIVKCLLELYTALELIDVDDDLLCRIRALFKSQIVI